MSITFIHYNTYLVVLKFSRLNLFSFAVTFDAAMSRSGLGWRNASAVAAAASQKEADRLGRGCPFVFSHRAADLPIQPSLPVRPGSRQASLSSLC